MVMDKVKRNLLLRNRDWIAEEILQPESILPDLISKRIIVEEEYNDFKNEKTRQARTRKLLDLLDAKNDNAFDAFCEAVSKDYHWVSDKLSSDAQQVQSQSQHDEPDAREDNFLDARLRGSVPLPPPHFVFREKEVIEVRNKLKELEHRKCLVLHGMTGSGKSCLAESALNCKEIVLGTFKGYIFWVSLGDGILTAQLALLNKFDRHWPVPLQQRNQFPVPTTESMAKDALIARILKGHPKDLKNGLIILDDVPNCKNSAASFDIGLRMLILTTDTSTVELMQNNCTVIPMAKGFSEEESLSLLAASVDLPTNGLSQQALEIHRKALGFPLVISLIGGLLAQYKEDAQHNESRWTEFSDMLSKPQRSRRFSFSLPGLTSAISQSLSVLSEPLRRRYYHLVVFDDDVNILPEVLSVFWGISKYEVEEHMYELMRKSLASRRWNEELRCYVYGVHYHLLRFLQNTLPEETIRGFHRTFVFQYQSHVDGNWSKLPMDNYSHLFLAKHMVLAGIGSIYLPKLLLNIEFVAVRLRQNMHDDLMRDFRRLKEVLDDNVAQEYIQATENYEDFVCKWKDLIKKYNFLDVVQCALQESKESIVHQAAQDIAKKNYNVPYFNTQQVLTYKKSPNDSLRLKEGNLEIYGTYTATSLCCQNVLLAKEDGTIILWDIEFGIEVHRFVIPDSTAMCINVTADHTGFAVATYQGNVYYWTLPIGSCSCPGIVKSFKVVSSATPPPRLRQISWQPLHGESSQPYPIVLDTGVLVPQECCMDFSNEGDLLAWCCPDEVIVWQMNEGIMYRLWSLDKLSGAKSLSFGLSDSVVFVAAGDIYLIDATNGSILNSLTADMPYKIFPKKDSDTLESWCLELNSQQLCQWEWLGSVFGSNWFPTSSAVEVGQPMPPTFISAALSPNQSLLVVITDNAQILVIQRTSQTLVCAMEAPPGCTIASLGQPCDSYLRAVLKGHDGSVCVMDIILDPEISQTNIHCTPAWCDNPPWIAHLKAKGEVRVLNEDGVWSLREATCLASNNEERVIIGTHTGQVIRLNPLSLALQSPQSLGHLKKSVTYVKCVGDWIIASSADNELWAWSSQNICCCTGLTAPIVDACIFKNVWLVVCTSKMLQAWNLSPQNENESDQECVTFILKEITEHNYVTCAFDTSTFTVALSSSAIQIVLLELQLKSKPSVVHSTEIKLHDIATSVTLNGKILAVVVPSMQTLILYDITSKRFKSFAKHSTISSITQIEFFGNSLLTAGSVLSWWQMPSERSHTGTLKLLQTLHLDGQCGPLKFAVNLNNNDILVSDTSGSLWFVGPLSGSNTEMPIRYDYFDNPPLATEIDLQGLFSKS